MPTKAEKEELAEKEALEARTQPPAENPGSGQFAVWDQDLGQYVSGVGDQSTAEKALGDLQGEAEDPRITDGHQLSIREV
jgi:hypothetical protein